MNNRLVLLPGWGLGPAALEPLVTALRGLDEALQVSVEPLPELDSDAPQAWLEALDARIDTDVWLGGWSLGGMLASELAARRAARCRGLITLGSNPCFVACADWPQAMPDDTFAGFLALCQSDPRATLKRFSLLCAQGARDPRGVSRALTAGTPPGTAPMLRHGLQVLARLDTRAALQRYAGPQLHLLASADALVPAQATRALQALLPGADVDLIEQASHAFVLDDPHGVAVAIQAFLSRAQQ